MVMPPTDIARDNRIPKLRRAVLVSQTQRNSIVIMNECTVTSNKALISTTQYVIGGTQHTERYIAAALMNVPQRKLNPVVFVVQ